MLSSMTSNGLMPIADAFSAIARVRLASMPCLRPAPVRLPPAGILIDFDLFQVLAC